MVLGKYGALLVTLLLPTVIIGLYPVLLSAYGNVNLACSLGTLLAFFLLGGALLSIGMFISSITESQAVAAGICFVVMLINYFIADLAGFVASTAFASYIAFAILVLLAVGLFYLMTKNGFASLVLCAVAEAGLLVFFMVSEESFTGAFPALMEKLSLFEQFYVFVNGTFDLTAVVYLLSVSALFVYLTIQSMEKRRWSE